MLSKLLNSPSLLQSKICSCLNIQKHFSKRAAFIALSLLTFLSVWIFWQSNMTVPNSAHRRLLTVKERRARKGKKTKQKTKHKQINTRSERMRINKDIIEQGPTHTMNEIQWKKYYAEIIIANAGNRLDTKKLIRERILFSKKEGGSPRVKTHLKCFRPTIRKRLLNKNNRIKKCCNLDVLMYLIIARIQPKSDNRFEKFRKECTYKIDPKIIHVWRQFSELLQILLPISKKGLKKTDLCLVKVEGDWKPAQVTHVTKANPSHVTVLLEDTADKIVKEIIVPHTNAYLRRELINPRAVQKLLKSLQTKDAIVTVKNVVEQTTGEAAPDDDDSTDKDTSTSTDDEVESDDDEVSSDDNSQESGTSQYQVESTPEPSQSSGNEASDQSSEKAASVASSGARSPVSSVSTDSEISQCGRCASPDRDTAASTSPRKSPITNGSRLKRMERAASQHGHKEPDNCRCKDYNGLDFCCTQPKVPLGTTFTSGHEVNREGHYADYDLNYGCLCLECTQDRLEDYILNFNTYVVLIEDREATKNKLDCAEDRLRRIKQTLEH